MTALEVAPGSQAASRLSTCLMGIALGDSLGLPYEGLPAQRAAKLMPMPLRQRLFFGSGFLSDDTLQSAFALQALLKFPDDPDRFQREFARRLRLWLLSCPPGIGLATLRAGLRLLMGVPPSRSGVYSGGNGAAMRAPIIGCAVGLDDERRIVMIKASTVVTHTHPLALAGAQIVALAAACSREGEFDTFEARAEALSPDWDWGLQPPKGGPTGYVVHTVNAAIRCWKAHPTDLAGGISDAVSRGGDTDTVAAILGGIIGASGAAQVPEGWSRWLGWPRPQDFERLAAGEAGSVPYGSMLGSHLLALGPILSFGFRRLLPPY